MLSCDHINEEISESKYDLYCLLCTTYRKLALLALQTSEELIKDICMVL